MNTTTPVLIGLDWGTSSLRACLIDGSGTTLETREKPWGILQLPAGGFEAALSSVTTNWPDVPIIASGMVGSNRGWADVPYVDLPAPPTALASALWPVETATGRTVHIVPGLRDPRGPDMMRGEETQLIGACPTSSTDAQPATWVLPGTHSKWAETCGDVVTAFSTCLTGELFAILQRHSILGNDAAGSDDQDAFLEGVHRIRDHGATGLLPALFSTRALMLNGHLPVTSTASYLSGLVIAEEWRAMTCNRPATSRPVHLIGHPDLCRRYALVAREFDSATVIVTDNAAARGLWHLALLAGLITP